MKSCEDKLKELRLKNKRLRWAIADLKKTNKKLRQRNFQRFTTAPHRVRHTTKEPKTVLDARRERLRVIKEEMNLTLPQLGRLLGIRPETVGRQIQHKESSTRRYISAMQMELAERLLIEYRQSCRRHERYLKLKHKEWLESGNAKLGDRLKTILLPEEFTSLEIRRDVLRHWVLHPDQTPEEIAAELSLHPALVKWHIDSVD